MRHTLRTLGLSLLTALGTQLLGGLTPATRPAQAQYIITLPNGIVCEGQFTGYNGNGICQYPDGYYRGNIVNGKRQGQGLFYYYEGDGEGGGSAGDNDNAIATVYEGQFQDDRPNGRGRFVYKNENRYEGEVRNGLPHGTGLFVFLTSDPSIETIDIPSDPYLSGVDWKQDEYLSRYYGGFANGVFSGQGSLVYGACRPYSVNSSEDLRCARYDGQFRNGVPHGRGTYNSDICVVRGSTYDCIRYSGNFWGGQPNGSGTLSFPNYGRCDGQFNDFTMSGRGTCRYNNGDRYNGDLRNGVPHGVGNLVLSGGRSYNGEFRLGQPFRQDDLSSEELKLPDVGGGFPTYPGRP